MVPPLAGLTYYCRVCFAFSPFRVLPGTLTLFLRWVIDAALDY